MSSSCPLRSPLSLNLLAQVAVIKQVHHVADRLESSYIDGWLERELSTANRELEQRTDVRGAAVESVRDVVKKYQAREQSLVKQKCEELKKKFVAADKDGHESSITKRTTRSKKGARKKAQPYQADQRGGSSLATTRLLTESQLLQSLQPRMVSGIPEGAAAGEYIKYRKCKYIDDIGRVREHLQRILSPGSLNDLMATMLNMSQYNNQHEHGLLTLQAMLSTDWTTDFRIASPKFHRNFAPVPRGSGGADHLILDADDASRHLRRQREHDDTMDTRIGTTILHFTLAKGENITHLLLGQACCDSVLKVVSETAKNLKYLNISGSVVTDQGLLYLCGVQRGEDTRMHLSRSCKAGRSNAGDRLVMGQLPTRWERTKPGCFKLTHFEGERLNSLQWPEAGKGGAATFNMGGGPTKYVDHSAAPMDCGMVAMLAFLVNLEVLLTEVGGRVVIAYVKVARSRCLKRALGEGRLGPLDEEQHAHLETTGARGARPFLPRLRVLSESHLTAKALKTVRQACPGLTSLKVDWYQFYSTATACKEAWLDGVADLNGLTDLRTSDIDFISPRMGLLLPQIGDRLVCLRLHEVWRFRYSFFKTVKSSCPNLEDLALTMTTRHVITTLNRIKVDKDLNLQLNGNDGLVLSKLERLHLTGPLGCDVAKYVLWGAEKVRSLYLGVEWLVPTFCDHQPTSTKDLLGVDYLKEILFVNQLPELTELHLVAQYRRGRPKLDDECLYFVLSQWPQLRHLGNFECWSLSPAEVRNLRHHRDQVNRDVTFDEDLSIQIGSSSQSATKGFEGRFEYKYIPGRSSFSCCSNPNMRKEAISSTNSILSDIFDVLAAPLGGDADDSDGSSMLSSSDSDSDSEDEDNILPAPLGPALAAAAAAAGDAGQVAENVLELLPPLQESDDEDGAGGGADGDGPPENVCAVM